MYICNKECIDLHNFIYLQITHEKRRTMNTIQTGTKYYTNMCRIIIDINSTHSTIKKNFQIWHKTDYCYINNLILQHQQIQAYKHNLHRIYYARLQYLYNASYLQIIIQITMIIRLYKVSLSRMRRARHGNLLRGP